MSCPQLPGDMSNKISAIRWKAPRVHAAGDELGNIKLKEPASSCVLSDDEKLVAVAIKTGILIYSASDRTLLDQIQANNGWNAKLAFAPTAAPTDLYLLVSSEIGSGKGAIIWHIGLDGKALGSAEVNTKELVQPLVASLVRDLCWKNDDSATILFAEKTESALNEALIKHRDEQQTVLPGDLVRFSPDGTFLLSAPHLECKDLGQGFWADPDNEYDPNNDNGDSYEKFYKQELVIWDIKTRKTRCTVPCPGIGVKWITVSSDSRLLAFTSELRKALEIWNAATGAREHRLCAGDRICAATFSPDSTRIAALVGNGETFVDVYSLTTGQKVSSFGLLNEQIHCFAWNPTWDHIAIWGKKGTINLWDPITGQRDHREMIPCGRSYRISNIRFVDDGNKLIFCVNGKANVWDFTSGARHEFIKCPSKPIWSRDGSLYIVLDDDVLTFYAPKW
ncbi:hypothetical protein BJX99DRAFT_262466 [Aspergillus californicus]